MAIDLIDPVFLINLHDAQAYKLAPRGIIRQIYSDAKYDKYIERIRLWILADIEQSFGRYVIVAGLEPVADQYGNWNGRVEQSLYGRVVEIRNGIVSPITYTEVLFDDRLRKKIDTTLLSEDYQNNLIINYIERLILNLGQGNVKKRLSKKSSRELEMISTSCLAKAILMDKGVLTRESDEQCK